MTQDIDDVIRRTYRYYYEDGLVETAVGLLFFIIGLALLGWHTIQLNSALGIGMVILSALLIWGGTLFVQKVIPYLKDRFTHPRTGQVVYRHDEPQHGNRWLMLAIFAVLIVTFFLPKQFNQMAWFEGGILGGVFVYVGYRVKLARFYWLGGAALLVGVAAVLIFSNDISGSAFTFSVTGLILLASGLIVLSRYLHRHPQIGAGNE